LLFLARRINVAFWKPAMPEIAESTLARRARTRAEIGLAGGLLTLGAIALVVSEAAPADRAVTAIIHALGISLPIALGLFRLSRRRNDRFAWLLVGMGLMWSLTTLAESSDPVLYSVGRTVVWVVEAALVYLMLAFPFGRLQSPAERGLVQATVLVLGVLYIPTILLAPFPEPTPWASCGTSCPQNAFDLASGSPAWVVDIVRPLREVASVLIYGGVAVVLIARTRRAAALMRRVLAPVAAVAVFRAAILLSYFVLRAAGFDSGAMDTIGWLYLLTLPLVTVAFAAGLVRQRLFVADALEGVTIGLKEHADAPALRSALASALADPSLRIVYWVSGEGGRWVDETGWPARAPQREPGRAVTEITVDGRRLAAVTHDSGLDPIVVQAAGAYALTTLENERLVARLQKSLEELAGSRRRIASVADRERRKIERDLHDGAQQRLVALRIKLELIAERLDDDDPQSAAALRKLEVDVDGTIDEVRSFARGIYPPLLAERGLGEALRAAGRNAPIATRVDAGSIGRHKPEIEATVYFACMEALQNAAKHADGASGVTITLSENPALHFEVHDDGHGFTATNVVNGNGLTNLRDRMAAIGGEVEVRSVPGEGTTVIGVLPEG
jgi:signal transduction histidine kinase